MRAPTRRSAKTNRSSRPVPPDRDAFKKVLFPSDKSKKGVVEIYWDHLCEGTSKSTPTLRGHCMRILGKIGQARATPRARRARRRAEECAPL